jgi:hypothetical protein
MTRFTRDGQPPVDPTALRRVVAGATVGTALEWYDFFIYGTAAALGLRRPVLRSRLGVGHADRLRHVRRRLRRAPVRRDAVFLMSRETKDVDIGAPDPAQEAIVSPAAVTQEPVPSR